MQWYKKNERIAAFCIFALICIIALSARSNSIYSQVNKQFKVFAKFIRELSIHYIDDIDLEKTMQTGMKAIVSTLDPYTNLFINDEIPHYTLATQGKYEGIGATMGINQKKLVIYMLHEKGSAYQNGLQIGDEITAINGKNVNLQSTSIVDITNVIKGKAGTTIQLTIQRYGIKEPFILTIPRKKIKLKNVPYYTLLTPEIGYIYLEGFTEKAYKEVKKALLTLKKQGITKLILDLRNNPGGILDEAIRIANLFIPKNQTIVTTKGKLSCYNTLYKTSQEPCDTNIAVVTLINEGSASASEIIAGVFQDYDRSVLIGNTTYGKGLVQCTKVINEKTYLKLTTSKYLLPSGRSIQAINYQKPSMQEKDSVSKRVAFHTKKGRVVYDGKGVNPDITIKNHLFSPITKSLYQHNLFFNYATHFFYNNKHIGAIKDFTITEKQYQNFVQWLQNQKYSTPLDLSIEELIAKIPLEYKDMQPIITTLKSKAIQYKQRTLQTFKKEISWLLKEQIVAHYYLNHGKIAASFDHDPSIQKAIALLNNTKKYHAILNPS